MHVFIDLFSTEFCLDKVTWFSFVLYAAFGLAAVRLVRVLGPVSIRGYNVELTYDDDETSVRNVVYRIFSPVVWANLFVLLTSVILGLAGARPLQMRWLPIACYWICLGHIKYGKEGHQVLPMWAFIVESLTSVSSGILFDWCVVSKFPELGVAALDQSNIGFQILVLAFYAVVQLIISSVTRRRYWAYWVGVSNQSPCRAGSGGTKHDDSSYLELVDTSEKKLFEYERTYGGLLPRRYESDLLLRAVFFSIMAIEDSNRPSSIRAIERLLCRLGHAKTTGIMQQRSQEPLSDEESVRLATGYISNMWDNYLTAYARSSQVTGRAETFRFGANWYQYRYVDLAAKLRKSFSMLYGDYSGTRTLGADYVLCNVLDFEERNHYGLLPDYVCAEGRLFESETSWFHNVDLYWAGSFTIAVAAGSQVGDEAVVLRKGQGVSYVDVTAFVDVLGSCDAELRRVSLVDGLWCIVQVMAADKGHLLDEAAKLGWS